MKQILFCFAFFLSASYCFSQQPAFIADSMDAYINRGLKEWDIPGLAVAVVKDGKVVFMKGYGIRQVGKPGKVDENIVYDSFQYEAFYRNCTCKS
jgi:CubicO group peptidase (beta-lactamase class C family)